MGREKSITFYLGHDSCKVCPYGGMMWPKSIKIHIEFFHVLQFKSPTYFKKFGDFVNGVLYNNSSDNYIYDGHEKGIW